MRENERLARYSTFGIGGAARWFVEVSTVDQMVDALSWARDRSLPLLLIGRGSNTLFNDQGFEGLAILNRIDGVEIDGAGVVTAGSGASYSRLGAQMSRQGWSGLEFASGIPGTVGGAVVMNAGANGRETADALLSVEFVTSSGQRKTAERADLEFGYRHSPFQGSGDIVVGARFQLVRSEQAAAYQREIFERRKQSQPYGDRSAGCIFRNPPGKSAGALIDQCGLKGASVGGASVSELHGNFIVNQGGATGAQVRELIEQVKQSVKKQTGIELQEEVRFAPHC